jgi:hypothetical protein
MNNPASRIAAMLPTALAPALLAIAGFAGAAQAAQPQAQAGHLGWQLEGSIEYGGDKVATVLYTNGSSQDVRAGQGVGIAAGGHYRFGNSPFDLSATVGLKYVTTMARNADIHINRTVFEAQAAWWPSNDTWISAGPVMHTGGGFSGGGLTQDLDFGSATGAAFRVGWRWVALGYTSIRYTDQFGDRIDASNANVRFVARF